MICETCKIAGSMNKEGRYLEAQAMHSKCTSVDCFCQHGIGNNWVAKSEGEDSEG